MTMHVVSEAPGAPPSRPDRLARLPLRAELHLVAHDDDTGRPHLHPNTLAVGLAGAILFDLWTAGRVWPGRRFDTPTGQWLPDPGHLALADPTPLGDLLTDAALATIRHDRHTTTPANQLRHWLRHFAATDLYQRVRADLVTVGVLRHTTHRRYGIARTDRYTPIDTAWPVRARGRIRSLIHQQPRHIADRPGNQQIALAGLVAVLDLAPYLHAPDITTRRLSTLVRSRPAPPSTSHRRHHRQRRRQPRRHRRRRPPQQPLMVIVAGVATKSEQEWLATQEETRWRIRRPRWILRRSPTD